VWVIKFFTACYLTSLRTTKHLLFIAAVFSDDLEVSQGMSICFIFACCSLLWYFCGWLWELKMDFYVVFGTGHRKCGRMETENCVLR